MPPLYRWCGSLFMWVLTWGLLIHFIPPIVFGLAYHDPVL